ncbi:MAG: tRNA (N(6)-L-threonylcarbamoyladenosine(37)-C(2))-methylthiotransferase [Candidatus Hodarchaeales archaeon]|jgi:MiaB-like tRNA modifying enzyme
MINGPKGQKLLIRLESYGCTANHGASEIMAGLLDKAGFEVRWEQGEAELVILNTCVVKSATHSKMLRRIRKIREKEPEIPMIVAGCMPQVYKDDILRVSSNVSVLGPHDLNNIVSVVRNTLSHHFIKEIADKGEGELRIDQPRLRRSSLSGIIQIARGCQSSCSYCIVKKVMGQIHSYPPEQIVEEVKTCIQEGCREILLTAQDLGAYGTEIETSLSDLLGKILPELPQNARVRLGMLNPGNLWADLDKLLKVISCESVYSMLHLPIQSGNDEVLQRMGRSYSVSRFRDIIKQIREVNPSISIHTDIIVGFPGETEEAFKDTLDLITWLEPDVVNVSKFSPRPGTAAAQYKTLPSHVVKARSKALADLCGKISFEKNKNFVGKIFRVLTLKKYGDNSWYGRTDNYKPVIYAGSSSCLGELATVYIKSATKTHLVGNTVPTSPPQ